MTYIHRTLESTFKQWLDRGKSIILFGARQTGKSTLVKRAKPDLSYSLIDIELRQELERDPAVLLRRIEARAQQMDHRPLVCIDEAQKVPQVFDIAQDLIDRNIAQCILTGSSARRIRRSGELNLLPGRAGSLQLDTLSQLEFSQSLEDSLLFGALPGLVHLPRDIREQELQAYTRVFLEEEIRAEAAVRAVGSFSRFLLVAAQTAGQPVNQMKLSQEIGVAHTTIAAYYQILEDCLLVTRIDALAKGAGKRRLLQRPRYLFFDAGVRRAAAEEPSTLTAASAGPLFEQWVGTELLKFLRSSLPGAHLRSWRDANGVEVDWVLEYRNNLIPIEVKWTKKVTEGDIRHLRTFMEEHPQASRGFCISRASHAEKFSKNIMSLPWQELPKVLDVLKGNS